MASATTLAWSRSCLAAFAFSGASFLSTCCASNLSILSAVQSSPLLVHSFGSLFWARDRLQSRLQ